MPRSFILKVNFLKGWPSPTIIEKSAQPATGVTIEAGMVGRLNTAGAWVLGITGVSQVPYIFRNESDDVDAGKAFVPTRSWNQISWGGVQGISFNSQFEVQTSQYAGTPAVGDQLYADTDGKLKVAITEAGATSQAGKVIVGVVTRGVHAGTGDGPVSYIAFVPDRGGRTS